MKKDILSRYERTGDGLLVIDVFVERVVDLYSYFGRTAPYLKKDLDPEFVDYLIECVREIGSTDFIIRVSLSEPAAEAVVTRVRQSIGNYFKYLQGLELRKRRTMFRTTSLLFGAGLVLFAISIMVNQRMALTSGVVLRVFAEGLTVAAWVSLWEALATLLIQWPPQIRDVRIYDSIANAQVVFRSFRSLESAGDTVGEPGKI